MNDLISRKELYEKAAALEAAALDYVGRLIERDGGEPSVEWKIWSAILIERTAFKHDIFDAPSAQQWIPTSERLPEGKKAVLVYEADYENQFLAHYEDGRWKSCDPTCNRKCFDETIYGHIVAWMPLPNPYQEVEE